MTDDEATVLGFVESAGGTINGFAVQSCTGLSWFRAHTALNGLVAAGLVSRSFTVPEGNLYVQVIYTTTATPAAAAVGVVPAATFGQMAAAGLLLVAVLAVALLTLRYGFASGVFWWPEQDPELQTFTRKA